VRYDGKKKFFSLATGLAEKEKLSFSQPSPFQVVLPQSFLQITYWIVD